MPRRFSFENASYYHIYNRGLNKKTLFRDMRDYQRFLFYIDKYIKNYKDQIGIVSYAILPNHFHFVLYTKEQGLIISKFIGIICASYTRYYKKKYQMDKGIVYFEGRFKSKHIDTEEYLHQCIWYVENNPVKHGIVSEVFMRPFKSNTLSDLPSHPGGIIEDLGREFDFGK